MITISENAHERLVTMQLALGFVSIHVDGTENVTTELGNTPSLDQVHVSPEWLENATDEEFKNILAAQKAHRRVRTNAHIVPDAWDLALEDVINDL